MKKSRWSKRLPQMMMIIVYAVLLTSVVVLMSFVQNLLNSDVKINLTEIVTQNKDVVTSKLKLEVNDIDSIASQIVTLSKENGKSDFESLYKAFLSIYEDRGDNSLFISDMQGNGTFGDGKTLSVSGRMYFKLACDGIQNISDKIVSRTDGEEVFVISVPIKQGDTVVGTMQKCFTPDEMYGLCTLSLFSKEGYMSIINSDGYMLITSQNRAYNQENENIYRTLYSKGNPKQSKQLEDDVKNNRAGFMETVIDGQKTFSAYTAIEDIHDWYLISSVATSAVSPNANIVIKMFYFILMLVVLIFGASLGGFLFYKNKQQDNLERIAFVDTVTNGDTFNKFAEDLRDILAQNQDKTFYVLKFDIDNFKYVNNFYGFDCGDRILNNIYQYIKGNLDEDERVARISGDNFVVLLKNTDKVRLNELLTYPQDEDSASIYYSAGVYEIKDYTESVNLMVDKAATAAHAAKGKMIKAVEFYSDEFDKQMIYNEQLKRAIKEAFVCDEMIPFFQPKVDVDTGKMVGAEALARWRTKEGKLVPPFEFIPLCEKTGLVTELDMIIFEKVLKFIRSNIDRGVTCLPISVNFSRLHLMDSDFLQKIVSKTQEYGVPAELVELELTESAIFDNYEAIVMLMQSLHENGFLVSMDDFGTGYSSLNMLKDVPIDVLKIDKEFLNKTQDSTRQKIIFSAIASMANDLQIKVVVEGVETEEHVSLMKHVKCKVAQGYLYSKPVDETTFEKMYEAGRV